MNLVFEVENKDKAKLTAIVEADPYAEVCFSRNGYKLKDGSALSEDKGKSYLFLKATDDFAKFAREKLNGVAAESAPEVRDRVAKKIEEEENSAEVGFGSIFGE